ncbi:MAG: hypothetical protein GXO73_05220 [Calditrichaeota bacterium]|nr:hypothetical protein [Calditrichota bacterium]
MPAGAALKKGQNVILQRDAEVIDFRAETVVVDVDDRQIAVACRTLAGDELALASGDWVYVIFIRPDALYNFRTRVAAVDTGNKVAYLERRDAEVQRIQRRQYFRVYVRVRVVARLIDDGRVRRAVSLEYPAQAENLSGGGLLLKVAGRYRLGDLLAIQIFLPDGKPPIEAVGKVVRVQSEPEDEKLPAHYGVEFVEIDERDRSRIIAFLNKIQASKFAGV